MEESGIIQAGLVDVLSSGEGGGKGFFRFRQVADFEEAQRQTVVGGCGIDVRIDRREAGLRAPGEALSHLISRVAELQQFKVRQAQSKME
jgi:hypothetical protein